MRFILFVLALLAFLAGGCILAVARSAIHEIEAFVLFLIGAVFISDAAIVDAVNLLQKELRRLDKRAPLPLPSSSSTLAHWYYAKAGKRIGPLSTADLKQMASSGQLSPNDMVWKEGMASWIPLHQLRD